ncbi:AbrB/MazE/SpoVT family DNA-binding domain-containing protein [Methylorubrum aminovorans]
MKLEIKRIGNSNGLILPMEFVGRLKPDRGNWLHVTVNRDGTLHRSPYDPIFEKGRRSLRRR